MDNGFIIDSYIWAGGYFQSRWVEGTPVQSWWSGLNLRGKRVICVSTYRCTSCGFLESYAI